MESSLITLTAEKYLSALTTKFSQRTLAMFVGIATLCYQHQQTHKWTGIADIIEAIESTTQPTGLPVNITCKSYSSFRKPILVLKRALALN